MVEVKTDKAVCGEYEQDLIPGTNCWMRTSPLGSENHGQRPRGETVLARSGKSAL